jgi:alkyl hydroperoxide reductase subunit AhpC
MYEYLGESWGLIVTHPSDFKPVGTTELAELARLQIDFAKRNVKIVSMSCDSIDYHQKWKKDIQAFSGLDVNFPIVCEYYPKYFNFTSLFHFVLPLNLF